MTSDPFVDYYSEESVKASTLERFGATKSAVMRAASHYQLPLTGLAVADIGCGAGTQCAMWARDGHRVHGIDINPQLVELGRKRAADNNLDIKFFVGSATALPWADASMDICLCPELLEHVAQWQECLHEAMRVLRPGGILYLSTTNKLCPVQEEFTLPGYSWYPAPLKRHYERLSVTTRPELVNHAKYPAVNWFTFFGLSDYLRERGFECLDRFDVAALGAHSFPASAALSVVRSAFPIRWLAHVLTPYTVVFSIKKRQEASQPS